MVDVLSDEALVDGAVAVEPGRGRDAQCVVGARHRPAGVDHSPSGRRRGVLANSVGRPQHCLGAASQRAAGGVADGGTSFARWSSLLDEHARAADVVGQADTWRQVAAIPAALPAVQPELDTYASAGRLSVSLDAETTRLLLGEVPAAFHAGVQDILLIAFGLAWTEFLGTGKAPIGIDVEGHGRHEELASANSTCRARWGGSPPSTRWRWPWVGCPGRRSSPGKRRSGPVIKDAKEQLRALPDGLTYGLLRYLNPDVDLAGSDPTIGFNYLGRLGAGAADLSDDLWRISQDSLSTTDVAVGGADAVGAHRGAQRRHHGHRCRPASAGRLDVGALGGGSRAGRRLSQLWFDALAGICAHVHNGGGGLTPSDLAPARLSQQQIDELQQQYRIADVLPLTPLQQGLLFQASFVRGPQRRCVCGAARHHRDRCSRSSPPARCGAYRGRPPSQPRGPLLRTVRRAGAAHPG